MKKNHRKNKRLLQSWASALICTSFVTASASAQGLHEAVNMALKQYPTLLSAIAKSDGAQFDIQRAQGAHWPQLSWSGTYNAYQSGNVADYWVQSPMVSLNIWSGLKIQSDIERSKAAADVGRQQIRLTRDDVALMTTEAYLLWAHQREMVRLAQANVVSHERILLDFIKITEIDTGRRIDLNQAQVRFDNARLSLAQREADLASASQRLRRTLSGQLPDEPTQFEWIASAGPTAQSQALASLEERHPLLDQLKAQVAVSQADLQRARSQYSPTVNLTHGKQTYQGLSQGRYVTQLIVNVPIWDGGSTSASVLTADSNLRASLLNLEEGKLYLRERISSYWSDWESATMRRTMGVQQTQVAQALVDGYWMQFKVGRRSLLDLLNVQSDLYLYQGNAATSLHETRLTKSRMLAAMGQLAAIYDTGQDMSTPTTALKTWSVIDSIPGSSLNDNGRVPGNK
jgi:adhesin transport system outer membrane protein